MIHIAVLHRTYVDLILSGRKTVECRLTQQAREPYRAIERGQRIYFKQSAGPYRLTAIADQVLFEEDLTPARVREIRRDYNELIRGEAAHWKAKRNSRYLTLVWLREVEAIDTGPAIPPLQGRAWLALDPARHGPDNKSRRTRATPPTAFSVILTPGNLRNSSLSVRAVIGRFPRESIGGSSRKTAGRPVTLIRRNEPIIETDIDGTKKCFRCRTWSHWFQATGARAGDTVVFTPAGASTYFVGLARGTRR